MSGKQVKTRDLFTACYMVLVINGGVMDGGYNDGVLRACD